MENHNATLANNTALPKMTREQMQNEIAVIETLLDSMAAVYGSADPSQVIDLIEIAQGRARQLCTALDSIHAPEGMQ